MQTQNAGYPAAHEWAHGIVLNIRFRCDKDPVRTAEMIDRVCRALNTERQRIMRSAARKKTNRVTRNETTAQSAGTQAAT
jgi:hypothetical protein